MAEKQPLSEETLREAVDAYVKKSLSNYQHTKIRDKKVIHDSVHGTNIFSPYEIAFLDLPIIQRLRRISQTDVASLVFPAGNHNRFEHTIGVAVIVGNMINSLLLKNDNVREHNENSFILNHCRVAAILHDCGHGPFSHLSEQIYAPELKKIKEKTSLRGASEHEILSYFIATSKPLKEFNEKTIKGIYNVDIDLDLVGAMIVGYIDKKNEDRKKIGFAIELINGAFDADKLDYILRDAHSTGIQMALDLPRLMHTLDVVCDTEGVNRLAIDISGVIALEEIVFNKMILTSTIYHHQKVRAAGCMLKSIIEKCGKFKNVFDYLDYTDDMIFYLNSNDVDEYVTHQLNKLKNRMLPKRAFCFSSHTLKNSYVQRDIMEGLQKNKFKDAIITQIAEYVRKELNHEISENDIWIDSPENPKFKEATQCLIKDEGSDKGYIFLREIFPTDDWVRAYSENKWRGFVYTFPENRNDVAKASKYVFESVFNAEFNSFAEKLCKIDDE